jgi:hypothetical protein
MGETLGFLLCVWFKLWGFLWEGLWRRKQVEGDFTESLKGVYGCAIGNFGVPQYVRTMEEGGLSLDGRGNLTFNFP